MAKLAQKNDLHAIEADEAAYGPIPTDLRRSLASGKNAVVLWGSGSPRREFLHVDDLASACRFVMEFPTSEYTVHTDTMCSHVNIGVGKDISIEDLAEMVRRKIGYEGEVVWDRSKPDGTPRKLLNVSLLSKMGWDARISLEKGIEDTYRNYLQRASGSGVASILCFYLNKCMISYPL